MKVDIKSVQLNIDSVDYKFEEATYNGMLVIVETNSKYVNASSFCKQYNKRLGRLYETQNWKEYISEFELEYKDELEGQNNMANLPPWSFKLHAGIPDKLKRIRGIYVHPKLINYIAMWCSPKYAITVGRIMDSINNSVHEQLKQENKEDVVENAKPIFEKKVEELVYRDIELENKQCWGYRDSSYKLDSWEQMDMERDLKAYEKAKAALMKAKETVDTWNGFIQQYFPQFNY